MTVKVYKLVQGVGYYNWTICPQCRHHNPWSGCKGPTPEVAHKIRMWHRECARIMMEDYKQHATSPAYKTP